MENNFKVNMNEYLPLRDVVFNTLRQAILKGELAPSFTIIHYCSGHFMKIVVNTVSPVLYRPNHMVINVVYSLINARIHTSPNP